MIPHRSIAARTKWLVASILALLSLGVVASAPVNAQERRAAVVVEWDAPQAVATEAQARGVLQAQGYAVAEAASVEAARAFVPVEGDERWEALRTALGVELLVVVEVRGSAGEALPVSVRLLRDTGATRRFGAHPSSEIGSFVAEVLIAPAGAPPVAGPTAPSVTGTAPAPGPPSLPPPSVVEVPGGSWPVEPALAVPPPVGSVESPPSPGSPAPAAPAAPARPALATTGVPATGVSVEGAPASGVAADGDAADGDAADGDAGSGVAADGDAAADGEAADGEARTLEPPVFDPRHERIVVGLTGGFGGIGFGVAGRFEYPLGLPPLSADLADDLVLGVDLAFTFEHGVSNSEERWSLVPALVGSGGWRVRFQRIELGLRVGLGLAFPTLVQTAYGITTTDAWLRGVIGLTFTFRMKNRARLFAGADVWFGAGESLALTVGISL